MDARQWSKLNSVVADALAEASPAARMALVKRACAEDKELLQEAESLLAEAEVILGGGSDDLEACADEAAARIVRDGQSERTGERIGAYVVVRKIDHGGMGTVYLAARADGCFEKDVAIKVLKQGSLNDDLVRRFRAEREVLARLDHPNIARLIDAGTTDDGLPYFIMEYVDGIPVTVFAKGKCETLKQRLELFLKVAAAVETAHSAAVIHRDLKPSNILVNREGEPKLLDFGIAKILTDEGDGYPQTISGQERLTPVFASPEQVQGRRVTRSSDVYSLGVVLYEILTNSAPFRFPTQQPTLTQMTRVICDQMPIAPSEAVKDRERCRELRGDLDAIVLRALRKDPSQRYSSVVEFAADIRHYLEGLPLPYRSTEALYPVDRVHGRQLRSVVMLGLLVLALVGAATVPGLFPRSNITRNRGVTSISPPSGETKSTAVLPSDSLVIQESDRYSANGIRDGILSNLTKVANLKITGGNSVGGYRESRQTAEDTGAAPRAQDPAQARVKETLPVRVSNETSSKIAIQAVTDQKRTMKNGKKLVWVPKQLGSNLPGHWVEADSTEAKQAMVVTNFSIKDIQDRQNQGVAAPTAFVGGR
jgi:serine/threonine protein kinase